MTYAAETTVTVARSRAELEELVRMAGATDVLSGELSSEAFAFVAFRLKGRNLILKVPEPKLDDIPHYTAGKVRVKEAVRLRKLDQLRRARWRLLVLATKAKLELIAAGQSAVEREFLADIITTGTRTLGEELRPQLEQLGESLPMLPAPRGLG